LGLLTERARRFSVSFVFSAKFAFAKRALPQNLALVHQGIENALLVKLTERKEFISRGLGKDTRSKTQDARHVSNGVNGLGGFIATKTPRHEEN